MDACSLDRSLRFIPRAILRQHSISTECPPSISILVAVSAAHAADLQILVKKDIVRLSVGTSHGIVEREVREDRDVANHIIIEGSRSRGASVGSPAHMLCCHEINWYITTVG